MATKGTKFYLQFYDASTDVDIVKMTIPITQIPILSLYAPGEEVFFKYEGHTIKFTVDTIKPKQTIHTFVNNNLDELTVKIPINKKDDDGSLDSVPEWWKFIEVDV